jgi:hypothetical protein
MCVKPGIKPVEPVGVLSHGRVLLLLLLLLLRHM